MPKPKELAQMIVGDWGSDNEVDRALCLVLRHFPRSRPRQALAHMINDGEEPLHGWRHRRLVARARFLVEMGVIKEAHRGVHGRAREWRLTGKRRFQHRHKGVQAGAGTERLWRDSAVQAMLAHFAREFARQSEQGYEIAEESLTHLERAEATGQAEAFAAASAALRAATPAALSAALGLPAARPRRRRRDRRPA